MNKHLAKIFSNAIRVFITPASLLLNSLIVVHFYGKALWGEFVTILLLINLITHFLQWGNKEYLVRAFSQSPANMGSNFYNNLFTRSLLILPVLPMLYVYYPELFFYLFLWITSAFFYLSTESIIVYTKRFTPQVFIETFSTFILFGILYFSPHLDLLLLIQVYTVILFIKTFITIFVYYPQILLPKIQLKELTKTFSFLVIGLSGLLQSRVDQYIIAAFSDKETLATFQIFLSAFILLQAFSAIIIMPFNKVLYRINSTTYTKTQRQFLIYSIPTVLVLGTLISFLLIILFQINISWWYFIFGILFAFPPFYYVPIIILYYRLGKEKEVIWINYIGAGINLIFTYILILNHHPYGAIIASAITQWLMLIWYNSRKKALIHEIEMSNL